MPPCASCPLEGNVQVGLLSKAIAVSFLELPEMTEGNVAGPRRWVGQDHLETRRQRRPSSALLGLGPVQQGPRCSGAWGLPWRWAWSRPTGPLTQRRGGPHLAEVQVRGRRVEKALVTQGAGEVGSLSVCSVDLNGAAGVALEQVTCRLGLTSPLDCDPGKINLCTQKDSWGHP